MRTVLKRLHTVSACSPAPWIAVQVSPVQLSNLLHRLDPFCPSRHFGANGLQWRTAGMSAAPVGLATGQPVKASISVWDKKLVADAFQRAGIKSSHVNNLYK